MGTVLTARCKGCDCLIGAGMGERCGPCQSAGSPAGVLYRRLARLKPAEGDDPFIRPVLTRAELALILPALKHRYELEGM